MAQCEARQSGILEVTDPQLPQGLIDRLSSAKRTVVLTGAGVSEASGIPTFRDALSGLWEHFDPAQLATPEAFATNPDLVWGWYEWRRSLVLRCEPNAGHRALAKLERDHPGMTLITQNVDGLHECAGSRRVVALHGSLHRPYCSGCGSAYAPPRQASAPMPNGEALAPPRCRHCGERVRPGVVWFGEALPIGAWRAAEEAARRCDLFMSVGTSALVYPAASLPLLALEAGATLVQVNPEPTTLDALAEINLRGTAAEILPMLVERAGHASKT